MKRLLYLLLIPWLCFGDTFEAIYNSAQWLPVVILDSTDESAETGVTYSDIVFWYKEGITGTWTELTLSATSCTATSGYVCEEDSSNAPGSYRVYVPSTVTDTKGPLSYYVAGNGYKTYFGLVQVKTLSASQESDKIDRIRP